MPNNEINGQGAEQQPTPQDRGAPPPVSTPRCTPDQVTPHRITTIAFIVDYLYTKQSAELSPADRTKISSLILNLVQFPDENLKTTCQRLVPTVNRLLLAAWAKRLLATNENGIAGLMDLFQAVEKLILEEKSLLRKKSLVGILLRRMHLQFDKMSFSEVSTLQIRFTAYFSHGKDILTKLVEAKDDSSADLDLSLEEYRLPSALKKSAEDPPSQEGDTKLMTRRQADLLIARQASMLQFSEAQALSPMDLQREVNMILKSNPGLPEAYFLSFLNSLRMNEFVGAMDSLNVASNYIVNSGNAKQTQEEVHKVFRYANLNLASLHSRLGHNSEALAAVKEAITIGQDAKDHVCLQHALSWLTRLAPGDRITLLQRSISKCEELSLPYLASLGMLTLCKYAEEFGDRPNYVLDLLTRSSVMNCKHNLTELQANSLLVRGNVWSTWGRPRMSQTIFQLLLQLNSASNKEGISFQGEAIALGLVNIALSLEQEGLRSEADAVLKLCEDLYPSPISQFSQVWKVSKQKILFSRHLVTGNWGAAESCLSFLASHVQDLDLFNAELFFKQGNFQKSRHFLNKCIKSYDNVNAQDGSERLSKESLVRAYILLSDIQVICNDPGGSVEYLLVAKELSLKHRLEGLHCLVCLHLANNQLSLGCAARALNLVRHCLTFLLAHGSNRDRSRGLLLCAKCRVAASAELPEVERRAELLEGAGQLDKAREGFLQLQDWDRVKDCLYLQARIYHSLALTQERNMSAQQYKKFDELYPTISPVHQLLLI